MPRLFPILLLLFTLLTVIKPEGTEGPAKGSVPGSEAKATVPSDQHSTLNQEPKPTVAPKLPVKPPTAPQGPVLIVDPKNKNLTADQQAIIDAINQTKPPPNVGITNPPKSTTQAPAVYTPDSKDVNESTDASAVDIEVPSENKTDPKAVQSRKQADLESCFRENKNITCFVGNKCRHGPILLENPGEAHEKIIALEGEINNLTKKNPARKAVIANCNVGAIFTKIGKGLYKFDYHTTSSNVYRNIVFFNQQISIDDENGEMLCDLKCDIRLIYANSVRFSENLYFTGEISIAWDESTEDDRDSSENGIDNNASPSPLTKNKTPSPPTNELEPEEKSKVGVYIAIGVAAFVALIVIAVVVVIMIQRHNTAKHNRLRAEIEAEVRVKVAEQIAVSRSRSTDKTRSKEQSPLLQSTQSTATASTSVSAVGLEPFSDPFSGSE